MDNAALVIWFSVNSNWLEIGKYYVSNFANHFNFFSPLTFLLATLRVLFDFNKHSELIALQVGGLSSKKLLMPFFALAIFLSLVSYANYEWVVPDSKESATTFKGQYAKLKKKLRPTSLYSVSLPDESELVYQKFHKQKEELFDVYWIKSPKDLWYIKYLYLSSKDSHLGKNVDHFQRGADGKMEKTESLSSRSFPEMVFGDDFTMQKFVPFESRPLSSLIAQSKKNTSERKSIACHLHYKLATPLFPFLILLILGPIAIQFNRTKPLFLIAALGIFGFVGIVTILDGMLILGENQVLPGYLAIWTPIALLFSLASFRFVKS